MPPRASRTSARRRLRAMLRPASRRARSSGRLIRRLRAARARGTSGQTPAARSSRRPVERWPTRFLRRPRLFSNVGITIYQGSGLRAQGNGFPGPFPFGPSSLHLDPVLAAKPPGRVQPSHPMSKSAARFALLCALVGLGASVAATYVHYRLIVDPSYSSFCDVSASVSCTQVYLSPYSTFRGIPVAVLGALWFAGAALLVGIGLIAVDEVRDNATGYLFAASTLEMAVVLYFEYVSFSILKLVCVLCLVM